MFAKFKKSTLSKKEEITNKAKDYLKDNKDKLKAKVEENEEIKKLILDKAMAVMSVVVIAGFLYELLPLPIKWVVSEDDFIAFTSENIDFIVDILG